MGDKKDVLENIDEQISKLKANDVIASGSKNDPESVKIDNNDTDTKIFDDNTIEEMVEVIDEGDTVVDLKKNEIIDNVDKFEKNGDANKLVPQEKSLNNKKGRQKNSKTKSVIVILVVLILLVSGVGAFYFYSLLDKDDDVVVDDVQKFTDEERAIIIKNYGEALEGIISVHFMQKSVLLEYDEAVKLVEFEESINCSVHEIYKDGKLYLNKCSVNGIMSEASYGEKQENVESTAEILIVYVSKTDKTATLSKPKSTALYDEYIVHCDGIYYDPLLLSENSDYVFYFDSEYNVQMKNYSTDEKILSNLNYKQVLPIKISDDVYDTTYVAVNVSDYWGIYNLMDSSQVISPMYSWFSSAISYGVGMYNSIMAIDNNMLIANDGKNYGVINYTTNKMVIPFEYSQLYKSGNYVWARDGEKNRYIYDTGGNKYLVDGYDKIYGIVNGTYILVRQEDNVKLVQIDGNVLYDYGKIDNIGDSNYGLVYNGGPLFQLTDLASIEGKCIEVLYNPNTKEGLYKSAECGGMAKPVLYLYPDEETNVIVSFENPEILETTYPKFVGKWQVTADSEGNLTDKSGKKYYALYWDEKRVYEVDFSEGFYVEKDEAITFLEEKLSYIGLNDYERNEFIMYWLPIIEKNEKNLIYFEFTEERNSYNKLYISPRPDSLLRVSMHVKKVDKKVNIKKQSLVKFKRKGFVAVEWGGMTY